MMRLAILAMFLCGPLPAAAQIRSSGPELYIVSGVASNDVLNIRAEPDASAAIVGSYKPSAEAVEVLQIVDGGAWGQVGLPEGNGWVSMRFLAPADPIDGAPRPVRCGGTEPFWGFTFDGDSAAFSSPMEEMPGLTVLREGAAINGFYVAATQGDLVLTLVAQNAICSDGMSDRMFGYQATLLFEQPQGPQVYNGCCTADGNN